MTARVKTAAQIANTAKVRLQQDIVRMLRAAGRYARRDTWYNIEHDEKLLRELGTYDLAEPERRSHLNKVAFPDENHAAVDAALEAGNNLNQIYYLALNRASVPTDSSGRFIPGKKGLKIVKHPKT